MDTPTLVDVHCHTEYAYCAATVSVEDNVRVARAMGLQGQCIVEHTFQLYFNEDDAWSWQWKMDGDLVRRAWAQGRGRMPEYRTFIQGVRDGSNGYVRLGLEVDLCADGSLLLAEEDRHGWDFVIGAIHSILGFEHGQTAQAEAETLFMHEIEGLLAHPIQVLAHPFRFFFRREFERPVHLYETVASMLSQSGVAAGLNFHGNKPDPRFFEVCLAHGVKIALASDAHNIEEVGDFWPHLRLLHQIGAREEDLSDVLYWPS
jgi:histidinol phosphatase-like PHP family hydrolase